MDTNNYGAGTQYANALSSGNTSGSYRNYLQSLADSGGLTGQEAGALLQVVGDTGGINSDFSTNPYTYTGAGSGANTATSGHISATGSDYGYGPEGITRLNDIYFNSYNAPKSTGSTLGTNTQNNIGSTQDAAFLTDQASQLSSLLGRTDLAQEQALKNNEDQYKTAYDASNADNTLAQQGFEKQTGSNKVNRQQAQTTNNVNANQGFKGLSQIIGRSAGTGSSAYQQLLPSVIGKDLSSKQRGVAQTFGQNQANIDQSKTQYDLGFQGVLRDLMKQKSDTEADIRTKIEGQRQGIRAQQGDNASKLAIAQGGGYAQAKIAQQPYLDAINSSKDTVEGFFDKYRTPYQYNQQVATTPDLAAYTTDRAQLNARGQGEDSSNPYSQMLRKKLQGAA